MPRVFTAAISEIECDVSISAFAQEHTMPRPKDDRQSLRIEVLLPSTLIAPLRSMIEAGDKRISELNISGVHGPLANGPIYRRHGLFKYEVTIGAAGHETLSDTSALAANSDEALMDESGLAGYRLAVTVAPQNSWLCLIQLFGYMAERSRRSKNGNAELLKARIRQLKDEHKGHTELQTRNALDKTVH